MPDPRPVPAWIARHAAIATMHFTPGDANAEAKVSSARRMLMLAATHGHVADVERACAEARVSAGGL